MTTFVWKLANVGLLTNEQIPTMAIEEETVPIVPYNSSTVMYLHGYGKRYYKLYVTRRQEVCYE